MIQLLPFRARSQSTEHRCRLTVARRHGSAAGVGLRTRLIARAAACKQIRGAARAGRLAPNLYRCRWRVEPAASAYFVPSALMASPRLPPLGQPEIGDLRRAVLGK